MSEQNATRKVGGGITNKNNLRWDIMPSCSCGAPNQKVMYFCSEKACPMNKTQKLYCPECFEAQKHPHYDKVQRIVELLKTAE